MLLFSAVEHLSSVGCWLRRGVSGGLWGFEKGALGRSMCYILFPSLEALVEKGRVRETQRRVCVCVCLCISMRGGLMEGRGQTPYLIIMTTLTRLNETLLSPDLVNLEFHLSMRPELDQGFNLWASVIWFFFQRVLQSFS